MDRHDSCHKSSLLQWDITPWSSTNTSSLLDKSWNTSWWDAKWMSSLLIFILLLFLKRVCSSFMSSRAKRCRDPNVFLLLLFFRVMISVTWVGKREKMKSRSEITWGLIIAITFSVFGFHNCGTHNWREETEREKLLTFDAMWSFFCQNTNSIQIFCWFSECYGDPLLSCPSCEFGNPPFSLCLIPSSRWLMTPDAGRENCPLLMAQED